MNDLISRAAALAIIDGMKPATGDMGAEIIKAMCWAGVKSCVPAVKAVPVVHGRWVADSDGLPVCSVCDEVAMQRLHCDTLHGTWRYDIRLLKTPYCPHCGARMDGERRDDDG